MTALKALRYAEMKTMTDAPDKTPRTDMCQCTDGSNPEWGQLAECSRQLERETIELKRALESANSKLEAANAKLDAINAENQVKMASEPSLTLDDIKFYRDSIKDADNSLSAESMSDLFYQAEMAIFFWEECKRRGDRATKSELEAANARVAELESTVQMHIDKTERVS